MGQDILKNLSRSKYLWPFIVGSLMTGCLFLSYGQVLGFSFTDVDTWPLILTGQFHSFSEFFANFKEPLLEGRMINAKYYRPILSNLYGLDFLLWGTNAWGYHLTDLTLHGLNALCVYFLVTHFMGQSGRVLALFAGLLFIIHPLHVENVPAIARRGDLLFTLFLLLSLICYFKHEQKKWLMLVASGFFALSLLSKESAVITPLIIMLSAWFISTPGATSAEKIKTVLLHVSPFAIVFLIYFPFRLAILDGLGGYAKSQSMLQNLGAVVAGQVFGLFFAGFSELWPTYANKLIHADLSLIIVSAVFLLTIIVMIGTVFYRAIFKTEASGIELPKNDKNLFKFALIYIFSFTLLFIVFGFNFRYAYPELVGFSILLTMGLAYIPKFFAGLENQSRCIWQKTASFLLSALILLTAGNLIFGSSIFVKAPLNRWQKDAKIADGLFKQVKDIANQVEDGAHLFLVNFPYQTVDHFRCQFASMPLSIITLEHAVQAYVDLHLDTKEVKTIGLSYLLMDAHKNARDIVIDTGFKAPNQINVHVHQGGMPTPLPWFEAFGPRYRGKVYEARWLDPKERDSVSIQLTEQGLELEHPYFLIADGLMQLHIVKDPFKRNQS